MLVALTREMWEARFPIEETVAVMETAGVMSDARDNAHFALDETAIAFLDPNTRSWYRPLFFLTWWGFWHGTHSVDATLLLWRGLEIGSAVLLIVGLAWLLAPRNFLEYAAATVAVAIFVGMPGFRVNLELPLLYTLVGMVFALIAWVLIERSHAWWHASAFVLLTVLAIGYKEQGLVLVPIIVGAWWVGAPGVRRGSAIAVTVVTLAYLTMRFATTASWSPFEQDVGFGFGLIGQDTAIERFGRFPYALYAYSAAATVGNILFSEPTDGVFRAVDALMKGRLAGWQINQVLTSTATTLLIGWWAVRTWKRDGEWSAESRLAVALVLAVAASGALGFNYARDRLGGMAVMFYALAAYHALRELASSLAAAPEPRRVALGMAILIGAAGWQARMIGTIDWVRASDRSAYREWISDTQQIRYADHESDVYLRILTALEAQGTAPVRPHTYTW